MGCFVGFAGRRVGAAGTVVVVVVGTAVVVGTTRVVEVAVVATREFLASATPKNAERM